MSARKVYGGLIFEATIAIQKFTAAFLRVISFSPVDDRLSTPYVKPNEQPEPDQYI